MTTETSAAASEPLLHTVSDGVATITLNRPAAFNAFSVDLKTTLLTALRQVADDERVRAVVITGAGKAFCAGQDLKEHLALVRDNLSAVATTVGDFYNPMVELVTSMPKPVIAAVNGVAAGAGAGLAYACDLRVAAASAVFRTSFAQVALTADSGLSFTLSRLIGLGRAKRLTLLDQPLDAATALDWGAVDEVVPDSENQQLLADRAAELAGQLAAGPTRAYGWIKQSLAVGAESSLADTLAFEDQGQTDCFRSPDHAEALAAFLGKRPPVFTGR